MIAKQQQRPITVKEVVDKIRNWQTRLGHMAVASPLVRDMEIFAADLTERTLANTKIKAS